VTKKEAVIHNDLFSFLLVIGEAKIPFQGGRNADLLENILKENGFTVKRTGDGTTKHKEKKL